LARFLHFHEKFYAYSGFSYLLIKPENGHLKSLTTRQKMYVYRNTEARSLNHCRRGKAIRITYSECVSVS
jgi:hypothetical protein